MSRAERPSSLVDSFNDSASRSRATTKPSWQTFYGGAAHVRYILEVYLGR